MPFVRRKVRGTKAILHRAIEPLEPRQLLSAALADLSAWHAKPFATPAFTGYTPAQVSAAYGFNLVADNGAGQTIAIVDAFDDIHITSDLEAFDAKFGLSNPTLNIMDEYGGDNLNPMNYDADWAIETSLDVEWAHAMAPGATIDLILTDSDSGQDLYNGVATAASLPGVSAVSMSWGGDEVWNEGDIDRYFMTPVGHQGVTFIASSGDSGMTGVGYPASSPYVLSVGGTSLNLSNGAYSSESAWDGSVGGESEFEPTPSYQSNVMITAHRTVPDVSYDADPNTGVNIVVTQPNAMNVPVQESIDVGGTSAAAPQWASIIAITNEERADNDLPTLNGVDQTLPALYSLYGARRHTAAYDIYHTDFNDVTTGTSLAAWEVNGEPTLSAQPEYSSKTLWDGGYTGYAAVSGYDEATGLGTPQVANLIPALAAYDPDAAAAHRSTSTATPDLVTMSRAERRRLQEALKSSVHADFVSSDSTPQQLPTQVTASAPASHPTAAPQMGLPNSLDHLSMQQASESGSSAFALGSSSKLAASGTEPSSATIATSRELQNGAYGGAVISIQSPVSLSLAAVPGTKRTSYPRAWPNRPCAARRHNRVT